MNKKVSQSKFNNLIAQTNYLSSMLQTYQSMLAKKFYQSEEKSQSRKFSSEGQSIFVESESEKKSRSNCFADPCQNPNMASLYFNNEQFVDEIFEHQMLERPTGYPRDEEVKKTREKIDILEKSIQVCHEAIQKQFEVKKELEEWNVMERSDVKEPLGLRSQMMNQVENESPKSRKNGKKSKFRRSKNVNENHLH